VPGAAPLRVSESAVLAEGRLQGPAVAVARAVTARAAAAFGLPPSHMEPPQLVRYRPGGDRYPPHVDWGTADDASLWLAGQRVATALVYLEGAPPAFRGGATRFTRLGVSVLPEVGTALAWPNVGAGGAPLEETEHEAEELEGPDSAAKVALNLWARSRPVPGPW